MFTNSYMPKKLVAINSDIGLQNSSLLTTPEELYMSGCRILNSSASISPTKTLTLIGNTLGEPIDGAFASSTPNKAMYGNLMEASDKSHLNSWNNVIA